MIELYPHNEKAYKKLVESLKTKPLAFIEHATGTGKSFIMLKYLYEVMREKRILIVSMHYEMFEQLLGSQMPDLGIKKDDFDKLDTMIYHNIIKEDPKRLMADYDCFIFDEAHHCGARKWSQVIHELKELVKTRDDKKMIGFTATGTRYLDDYLDVSNEFFDGNTVSRLGVAEAILEYLLPAPLYVNSTIKCVNKIDYLLKLLKNVPINEEVKELQQHLIKLQKELTNSSDVPSLIKKYNISPGEKYIVFCSSIDDLKEKMREAKDWFSIDVKMYSAHSKQSRDINKQEINDFSNNKTDTCLMFAVDIFNEGFHVDDVDGIFMFRHTVSPIVYLPQIGRALSFSLRKKQIKIFDMVDNISDNDVILELYKEIIVESKRLIKEHPEKRTFYEEILSRFQIIDKKNQVMEELATIEEKIKNKYLIRNQIDQAILRLREYRYTYPNGDVYQDLYVKKISKNYLNAYRTIINNRDYLTDEHIIKLSQLNIAFHGICLDINVRRQELGDYKNYKELELGKLKEFIESYVVFVNEKGIRPRKNTINDEEYALYKRYRDFLNKASKKNILKLINTNQLPSTVEELVLIGSIPSGEKIKTYLDHIRYNIVNNIALDEVESKVFNRIKKAIWIDDEVLLKYIESQSDFGKKIDDRIKIIAGYLAHYPDEKFKDIRKFMDNRELFEALKYLYKHWARVSNDQFKELLKLGICLPKELDMTWDERINILNNYDSFYEKEQVLKNGIINQLIVFVKVNKSRPKLDSNNEEERELAKKYNDKIYDLNIAKMREFSNVLKTSSIPLSFDEKLILGEEVETDELTRVYHDILARIGETDLANNRDVRILNRLVNNAKFLYKDEAKIIINSQKFARDFYNSLYKIGTDEERSFLGKVYSNYKHLSSRMVLELEKRGIKIPIDIVANINLLDQYRTLYEQERIPIESGKYQYLEYVKQYKKRPNTKHMKSAYRNYLSRLYGKNLEVVLDIIKDNIGSLTSEEELLLGNIPTDVSSIVNHLKNDANLDLLDQRLYRILLSNKLIDGVYASNIDNQHNFIEHDMFKRLIKEIDANPLLDISIYPEYHYLSKGDISKLHTYQINHLARVYLPLIYDKVYNSKCSLETCLTKDELKVFCFLMGLNDLDNNYRDLLVKITRISYNNSFLEKNINYQNFLNEYISFIVNHQGIRPSVLSDDELEVKLATIYEEMKDLLDISDMKKIDDAINLTISKEREVNFFDTFIEFVKVNNRFPCNNALDEDEILLANTFISVSKKLTKDQIKYINLLRKKVAVSTIKMTKEFDRIRKESNNEKKKN